MAKKIMKSTSKSIDEVPVAEEKETLVVEDKAIVESTPVSKETMAVEEPRGAHVLEPDRPPQQPLSSPYAERPAKLIIGRSKTTHYVPKHLLHSTIWNKKGPVQISLPDVNASTGHTLVHYLYTGTYQTLDSGADSSAFGASHLLKRALLVYLMTIAHDLPSLRELAMHEIEEHGARLNIFEILEAVKECFAKLEPDSWVHDFLQRKARSGFQSDHTIFTNDSFLECLGNAALNKFMMRCVMDLYAEKISCMHDLNKEMAQKLDDRDETIRTLSIMEAVPEPEVAILEDFIIPHDDEPNMDQCCGEEVFEEETPSIEDFCTISCPASEYPDMPAEDEEPAVCPDEPTECTVDICPPAEECYAEPCSISMCAIESTEVPVEDVAVAEPAEVASHDCEAVSTYAQPVFEPEPVLELEISDDRVYTGGKNKKKMIMMKRRQARREREELAGRVDTVTTETALQTTVSDEVQYDPDAVNSIWTRYSVPTLDTSQTKPVCEPIIQDAECVSQSLEIQAADCEPTPAPTEDVREPDTSDNSLCPSRASHILEGNGWKTCRSCRAIVEQVVIQTTRVNKEEARGWP